MSDEQQLKRPITLYVIIGLLAATVSALVLIDVAELQASAMISVRAHNVGDTGRPFLDLSLGVVLGISMAPLAVLCVALLRRWSLPYFLAWMLVVILAVLTLAASAGFATYRYWRDYQVGAKLESHLENQLV